MKALLTSLAILCYWCQLTTTQREHFGVNRPHANEERPAKAPDYIKCQYRHRDWFHNGHNYFYSLNHEEYQLTIIKTGQRHNLDYTWQGAQNQCRERCMNLVAINSAEEYKMLVRYITLKRIKRIWTAGRECTYQECGMSYDYYGVPLTRWYWSGSSKILPPYDDDGNSWPWSTQGYLNSAQPDNAEEAITGHREECVAIFNNRYNDGIRWHDSACYHKMPFICEDSDALLSFMKKEYGEFNEDEDYNFDGQALAQRSINLNDTDY